MRLLLFAALTGVWALASCSLFFPAAVEVSVYQSVLGDYSSRPIWEWSIIGINQPRTVGVSLNGAAEIDLPATVRSYRPAQHLTAGDHTLTVSAGFGSFFGPQASGSATATVATVQALPAFSGPDDPDDPCFDTPGSCPLSAGQVQWALSMHEAERVWDALTDVLAVGADDRGSGARAVARDAP